MDGGCNHIATYHYDAWGNHKVLDANYNEITDTSHIGHINPIRYRGYYYDSETGLYYCNARYYDPTTGRFISADDISYLDPETINGLNLFSYCGNNPVMNVDPSGHSAISFLTHLFFLLGNYISWHRGVPVIEYDIEGLSSFAFGIIFLKKNAFQTEADRQKTLNHEWGHTRQLKFLGAGDFFTMIAIPSVINSFSTPDNTFITENYYKYPWEVTADMLGGVDREGTEPIHQFLGTVYLLVAKPISQFVVKPILSPIYFTAAALIDGIIPGLGTTLLSIMYAP